MSVNMIDIFQPFYRKEDNGKRNFVSLQPVHFLCEFFFAHSLGCYSGQFITRAFQTLNKIFNSGIGNSLNTVRSSFK